MSITYSECVFVALGIQHAQRMLLIVICGLSSCTVFFPIISQTTRFSGKGTENKMCAVIFSATFVLNITLASINPRYDQDLW